VGQTDAASQSEAHRCAFKLIDDPYLFRVKNNQKVITFDALMQIHIVQIVYSIGLRHPKAVLSTLGLARDSHLSIQTKAENILLTPLQSPRSTWQATFMAAPAGEPDNLWGDLPLAESWN